MTKKDFMGRLKSQLKALIQSEKFAEARAGDILITSPGDTFEVGAECFYVDEAGNNVPLNEGEYVLDNGLKIEVEGGKIVEISKPEIEGENAPEDLKKVDGDEPAKMEAQTGIDMVEYGDMKKRLEALELMVQKMMEDKKKMESDIAKFSSLPAEKAIERSVTENQPIQFKKDAVTMDTVMEIRKRARSLNRTK